MTRDEWRRAEPILTRALLLPEGERQLLLDTAFLEEAFRREMLEALRRSSVAASGAAGATPGATVAVVPQRPVALNPGDALELGRFVVVRQIGRGGMGTVYLAHDTTLGTLVGLKVLPFDDALIAEARRAAACSDHPHVATVHNVLRSEFRGAPLGVLVMEYVAGTPASRLIDDGPVELGRVLRWARQVADAIAHAHDCQVLHCDLKPANIIITPDDRAKVLDFGIARATFDAGAAGGPVRGTLPYMAPEQLLAGQFSAAGDIYALGVTLFELITGQRPFAGDGSALRLRILMEPPPRVSAHARNVPVELDAIVERALAKNPDERYRSARALARALEPLEEAERIRTTTVRVPVAPVPSPSVVQRAAVAGASLLATLTAVTALGAFTSASYNLTLGRAGFANDTVFDWLEWGFRASVGPVVMLVAVLLAWSVVRLLWRLAASVLPAARRLDTRVRDAVDRACRRVGFDDPAVAGAGALVVSLAALGSGIYLYRDFLPALATFAANGSLEALALMSPDYVALHNAYRQAFSLVVIACVAAWYPILKSPGGIHAVPRGLLIGGAMILAVALVLLHHPHRLLFSELAGHGVEAVRWQGDYCYVLGQRGSDTLLLCPDFAPPRHHFVRTGAPQVEALGVRESVFRGFYRQTVRNRTGAN